MAPLHWPAELHEVQSEFASQLGGCWNQAELQLPALAFWHVREPPPQFAFEVQETDEQLPSTGLLQE